MVKNMKESHPQNRFSRRRFIKTSVTVASVSLIVPGLLSGCQLAPAVPVASATSDAFDEALKMMSDLAPLTNHGPMASEALVSLGREDQVIPFVESYKKRFSSVYPPKQQVITKANWTEGLSDAKRTTDWIDFFDREIKEEGWKQVVRKWSERLAPGLSAAAAHGLIRTGHAVRSLTRNENDLRKRELAEGMGYWAAYYQVLPESKTARNQEVPVPDAIWKIPMLPVEMRIRGSIMEQLKALSDFPSFGETINLVDLAGMPDNVLSLLTEAFAGIYAKNVSLRNNIALIHAVTGPANIRSLLPYLSRETTDKMLRYGWQAAAGIYSISGNETNNPVKNEGVNIEGVIDQAATSKEEHAIKFTEACVSEYKLNPKPIYLTAARVALESLGRNA